MKKRPATTITKLFRTEIEVGGGAFVALAYYALTEVRGKIAPRDAPRIFEFMAATTYFVLMVATASSCAPYMCTPNAADA